MVTRIKSPQLYQLSYRPGKREPLDGVRVVPVVYPIGTSERKPDWDGAPLEALRRVTVGGAS